jgi:hypothetical protein
LSWKISYVGDMKSQLGLLRCSVVPHA